MVTVKRRKEKKRKTKKQRNILETPVVSRLKILDLREWGSPKILRDIVSLSGEAGSKTGVIFITVGNKRKKESLVTLPWPDDGQAYGSYPMIRQT